jgi:hypothetical protein
MNILRHYGSSIMDKVSIKSQRTYNLWGVSDFLCKRD